jgi:hypothetical protein
LVRILSKTNKFHSNPNQKTMKTITIVFSIALALSSFLATAQAPLKEWDARFGGSDGDFFFSLQQTTDGGYILGGYSLSGISGDKTQASHGVVDYWIVKTDGNGIKQWDARLGGSSVDGFFSLQQTADGGYILGGYSNSGMSGDKTEESQGDYDYWIIKTDGSGVKEWDAGFGGTKNDVFYSLQQTTDGGYILGGYSLSGISGDKTQANQGANDYWIVKTDGSGVKQWDSRFGGNRNDDLHCIQQTADGGYILGGESYSGISGDKTQANQGLSDYWIVKTDGNGVKQWDAQFGGNDHDRLYSLQQTTDGGYILGGESYSQISGDKTQESQGLSDYWIVKTDGNGVKQWDARFGGSNEDVCFSLQQTADGGYILGGRSWSGISGDKSQESWGGIDYWIVKTDGNGAKQWDARFGGFNDEYFSSLQQTNDGGYILGGSSYSRITGDKSQASQGALDYWIIKTDAGGVPDCNIPSTLSATSITATTATLQWNTVSDAIQYQVLYKATDNPVWTLINTTDNDFTITDLTPNTTYAWKVKSVCSLTPLIISEASERVKFTTPSLRLDGAIMEDSAIILYPNPVQYELTIKLTSPASEVTIVVFDLRGKRVDLPIAFQNAQAQLNTATLPDGIYTLQITNNIKGISDVGKFVKQR